MNKPRPPVAHTGSRDAAYWISLAVAALIGLYLLLTSTTTPVSKIWPYDFKRMLEFGLLLFLFLVPLLNARLRFETGRVLGNVPRWLKLAFWFILLAGVVSSAVNARSYLHLANSLSEVALMATLVLGVFVVAACRRLAARDFDRVAFALLVLMLLAVGLQELSGVAAAHAGDTVFNFRVSLLHFSFPRFFNQLQSWLVPAIIALPILFSRFGLAVFLCAVALGLQWYIILMTGARGTAVAVLFALALTILLVPAIRTHVVKWQLAGLLLGALVFWGVMSSFESDPEARSDGAETVEPTQQIIREADQGHEGGKLPGGESSFFRQGLGRPLTHTSGRYWMWKIALEEARSQPLLGMGPLAFACTLDTEFGHPHSFPIQLAAEWGFPAALLACVVTGLLLLKMLALLRGGAIDNKSDEKLAALLMTGTVAAAAHACLSGVLVMPASQVTGLLVVGMLLGLVPTRRDVAASRAVPVLLPALVLSLGLLTIGVHELGTMEARSDSLSPGMKLHPRIWQDSKVCGAYTVKTKVTL